MKHDYGTFIKKLKASLRGRDDVVFKVCEKLKYKTAGGLKSYDLIKISSRGIKKTDKIVLITAGIHGDETFGPLTLMKHIGQVFDYAHKRGVKLVIFPLNNPSGFEAGTRYNIENDHGTAGNNDFMRYVLPGGRMIDDLRTSDEFVSWVWSSDPWLKIKLPQETRALHREMKKLPLKRIKAVVDIHRDNYVPEPFTYQYSFGDFNVYAAILKKIKKLARILANVNVDSGYLNDPGFVPKVVKHGKEVDDEFIPKSDKNGFIVRHDGSLTDLLYRLGTKYCIVVESTKGVKQSVADKVNLIWIEGAIDLVKKDEARGR
ncbi:MAG: succinylglutamate desuccinylase/aspartoacylase family protein [Candidatus Magasanikbacteria bacterium]|nr:succinylglutamate desuccinylase/aspartoacylase family protein [Candidatus Magasanikbacteria bacterium]